MLEEALLTALLTRGIGQTSTASLRSLDPPSCLGFETSEEIKVAQYKSGTKVVSYNQVFRPWAVRFPRKQLCLSMAEELWECDSIVKTAQLWLQTDLLCQSLVLLLTG